ncbi:putative pentatricopeptide repeat-containing protein [Corchorus olitorius]|uniref:Pentatricopeptide repeat-containing protein n=1 Tax=Corchorus olitorius TaxID=93759 RepID=A0A1R3GQB6_9ROSI|nr:putative pentatricopeptide repeat-containing protein [Corchorus olitorius]
MTSANPMLPLPLKTRQLHLASNDKGGLPQFETQRELQEGCWEWEQQFDVLATKASPW